jgi:DNA-damage-inducible protein J
MTKKISLTMDSELKHNFDEICKEIGLPSSAVLNMLAKTVVRYRKLPYESVELEDREALIARKNAEYWARIERGIKQLESGRGIVHDVVEVEE